MITTKYNFKLWLRRKYPQITATPIYGIPAYILSKPMDAQDNFIYNVQQLPDGRYVVFIGMTPDEAKKHMSNLRQAQTPDVDHRTIRRTAPTTFSAFEQWLARNNIQYIHRTFCANTSEAKLFQDESRSMYRRAWYMYELAITDDEELCGKSIEEWFPNIPHIVSTSTTLEGVQVPVVIVLIKASSSTYKSKRQRFMEKFDLMQPLYEQIIGLCAKAMAMEDLGQTGAAEWEQALHLCEQYMGIFFEQEGTVELAGLKEAAHDGTLSFFTRDRANFLDRESDEETF